MKKKNIHTNGFTVPENYFDLFEAELYNRIAAEELPDATGFTTPEGYFDRVTDRVVKTVMHQEEQQPSKVILMKPMLITSEYGVENMTGYPYRPDFNVVGSHLPPPALERPARGLLPPLTA